MSVGGPGEGGTAGSAKDVFDEGEAVGRVPNDELAEVVERGELGTVGCPGEAGEGVGMFAREEQNLGGGGNIPDGEVAVGTADGEQAGGRPGKLGDFGVEGEEDGGLIGADLPDLGDAEQAAGGELVAEGAEGDGVDFAAFAGKGLNELAGLGIPETGGVVGAAGGEPFAVGGPGDAVDEVLVAGEDIGLGEGEAVGLPEAEGVVVLDGGEAGAVGRPREGLDGGGERRGGVGGSEVADFSPGGEVPDADGGVCSGRDQHAVGGEGEAVDRGGVPDEGTGGRAEFGFVQVFGGRGIPEVDGEGASAAGDDFGAVGGPEEGVRAVEGLEDGAGLEACGGFGGGVGGDGEGDVPQAESAVSSPGGEDGAFRVPGEGGGPAFMPFEGAEMQSGGGIPEVEGAV